MIKLTTNEKRMADKKLPDHGNLWDVEFMSLQNLFSYRSSSWKGEPFYVIKFGSKNDGLTWDPISCDLPELREQSLKNVEKFQQQLTTLVS